MTGEPKSRTGGGPNLDSSRHGVLHHVNASPGRPEFGDSVLDRPRFALPVADEDLGFHHVGHVAVPSARAHWTASLQAVLHKSLTKQPVAAARSPLSLHRRGLGVNPIHLGGARVLSDKSHRCARITKPSLQPGVLTPMVRQLRTRGVDSSDPFVHRLREVLHHPQRNRPADERSREQRSPTTLSGRARLRVSWSASGSCLAVSVRGSPIGQQWIRRSGPPRPGD